jgi:hypothetical protein
MSKKSLYILIGGLVLIIGYLLFMPTTPPAVAPEVAPEAPVTEGEVVPEARPAAETAIVPEDTITIEGLFLSLAEEKTDFRKSFYYLLLDDGTEVVRIDLRPLLGYEIQDPVGKLGVDRGQQVIIEGTMGDEGFVIANIKPAP